MFIAISIFILLAIVFIILFLFKSINKRSYIADDGTIFDNQSDLNVYQSLYEKTKLLFSVEEDNGSSQQIQGFEKSTSEN